jgi:hypothetical protein
LYNICAFPSSRRHCDALNEPLTTAQQYPLACDHRCIGNTARIRWGAAAGSQCVLSPELSVITMSALILYAFFVVAVLTKNVYSSKENSSSSNNTSLQTLPLQTSVTSSSVFCVLCFGLETIMGTRYSCCLFNIKQSSESLPFGILIVQFSVTHILRPRKQVQWIDPPPHLHLAVTVTPLNLCHSCAAITLSSRTVLMSRQSAHS